SGMSARIHGASVRSEVHDRGGWRQVFGCQSGGKILFWKVVWGLVGCRWCRSSRNFLRLQKCVFTPQNFTVNRSRERVLVPDEPSVTLTRASQAAMLPVGGLMEDLGWGGSLRPRCYHLPRGSLRSCRSPQPRGCARLCLFPCSYNSVRRLRTGDLRESFW